MNCATPFHARGNKRFSSRSSIASSWYLLSPSDCFTYWLDRARWNSITTTTATKPKENPTSNTTMTEVKTRAAGSNLSLKNKTPLNSENNDDTVHTSDKRFKYTQVYGDMNTCSKVYTENTDMARTICSKIELVVPSVPKNRITTTIASFRVVLINSQYQHCLVYGNVSTP